MALSVSGNQSAITSAGAVDKAFQALPVEPMASDAADVGSEADVPQPAQGGFASSSPTAASMCLTCLPSFSLRSSSSMISWASGVRSAGRPMAHDHVS